MSRFFNARHEGLAAYVPGEQPASRDLIKLNTNESPFPPSPRAVEAVSRDALENARLYCDIQSSDLRAAIAARLGVSEASVLAGNGSDEILSFLYLAYGDRGAYFPDVSYGFYRVWARLYGVEAVEVPVGADFSIDPGDYMKNDRMVILANPNAPTGMWLTRDQVAAVAKANPDQIVVIDEAYVDFGAQSAVGLTGQFDNLIVVQTFSKSRSLAGARLGFAVGCAQLIEDIDKVRCSINPYNVNALTQRMGAASMRDAAYFDQCVLHITQARQWTREALEGIGFRVLPSRTNFLFASPPDGDAQGYLAALRAQNILIRHFNAPRTRAFVRISIGTLDQMRRVIDVTKEIYA